MSRRPILTAACLAILTAAAPALADPGRGNGNGNGKHRGPEAHHAQPHRGDHRGPPGHARACPPGLAKKTPACVPPGQARQIERTYGRDVGQVLRIGDYVLIRDPQRLNLESRPGWQYYRDGDRVYRVDGQTQQILTVLNLAQALLN